MPSAGRPFTAELITTLVAGGVFIAPITLHTGVSSQEGHEPPYPERFRVPRHTANLVNAAREWGGRVIAVGTTVVRAIETVSQPDGAVAPADGWTGLVVTAERGLWAIDGLLTGLHEPECRTSKCFGPSPGRICSSAATRLRSSVATAGTSSATATSSFLDELDDEPTTDKEKERIDDKHATTPRRDPRRRGRPLSAVIGSSPTSRSEPTASAAWSPASAGASSGTCTGTARRHRLPAQSSRRAGGGRARAAAPGDTPPTLGGSRSRSTARRVLSPRSSSSGWHMTGRTLQRCARKAFNERQRPTRHSEGVCVNVHTITPHVVVPSNAAKAVDWYHERARREERLRIPVPDGRLMSVELRFGDSAIMLADEFPGDGDQLA